METFKLILIGFGIGVAYTQLYQYVFKKFNQKQ